jgi:hypothetical protein
VSKSIRAGDGARQFAIAWLIVRRDIRNEGGVMNKDQPLKPEDFPLETDDEKLKTHEGRDIAKAKSEKVAENLAERANEQAHREEQDRWSA